MYEIQRRALFSNPLSNIGLTGLYVGQYATGRERHILVLHVDFVRGISKQVKCHAMSQRHVVRTTTGRDVLAIFDDPMTTC